MSFNPKSEAPLMMLDLTIIDISLLQWNHLLTCDLLAHRTLETETIKIILLQAGWCMIDLC